MLILWIKNANSSFINTSHTVPSTCLLLFWRHCLFCGWWGTRCLLVWSGSECAAKETLNTVKIHPTAPMKRQTLVFCAFTLICMLRKKVYHKNRKEYFYHWINPIQKKTLVWYKVILGDLLLFSSWPALKCWFHTAI